MSEFERLKAVSARIREAVLAALAMGVLDMRQEKLEEGTDTVILGVLLQEFLTDGG